jgi:hypothetical protein
MPRKARTADRDRREYLSRFVALPAEQKLAYLEELNSLLRAATPPPNLMIWEELKKRGW